GPQDEESLQPGPVIDGERVTPRRVRDHRLARDRLRLRGLAGRDVLRVARHGPPPARRQTDRERQTLAEPPTSPGKDDRRWDSTPLILSAGRVIRITIRRSALPGKLPETVPSLRSRFRRTREPARDTSSPEITLTFRPAEGSKVGLEPTCPCGQR